MLLQGKKPKWPHPPSLGRGYELPTCKGEERRCQESLAGSGMKCLQASAALSSGPRAVTAGASALGRFPARWEQAELELCAAAKPATAQSSHDVQVQMQHGHLSLQGNYLL